jgi:hypothetical protein
MLDEVAEAPDKVTPEEFAADLMSRLQVVATLLLQQRYML